MKRRALTMLELIIVIALLGILMVVTMVKFRSPLNAAGSRALAEQVAESFRAARNQAMVEQSPVAVVIPGQSGTFCSQSLVMMRGQNNPFNSYVHNYSREFPDSVLYVGTYPHVDGWDKSPIKTGRTEFWQFPLDASPDSPLRSWLGSRSNFTFIFTPDGLVHGNDLPHVGSDYAVVVSQGVVAQSGSVAGIGLPVSNPPPVYQLMAACKPYTVLISAMGSVRVVPGLAGSSGGVALSDSSLNTNNVAVAPTLTAEALVNPAILQMSFSPQGAAHTGLGVAATLDPKRQVKINIFANITTSDDLYCNITSKGWRPSSASFIDSGSFSSAGAKRMTFIPPSGGFFPYGIWGTFWQWNPPPGALPGDQFTFNATITTRRGGSVDSSGMAVAQRKLEIYDKGKIYFGGKDPYSGRYEIYSIRADGTDLTHVTHNEVSTAQMYPAATRDGNKVLFASVEPFVSSDLYGLSRNGGLSTQITIDNKPSLHSNFSDDSAVAVFERADDFATSNYEIYTFNPNSLWPPSVSKIFTSSPAQSSIGCTSPAISGVRVFASPTPNSSRLCDAQRRVAFESDCQDSGKRAIYTANFCNPGTPYPYVNMDIKRQTIGAPANLLNDNGDRYPVWHPGGGFLAFQSNRSGKTLIYSVPFRPAGVPPGGFPPLADDAAELLTPGMNVAREPYFSPDGRSLCFLSDDPPVNQWDIHIIDFDVATGKAVPSSHRQLMLSSFTPFSGGITDLNRPCWTQ